MNESKTANQEWRKISKRKPKPDLSNYKEFIEKALARFSKISLTDELFDETGSHGPLVVLEKGHVPDLVRYNRNYDRYLSFIINSKSDYNSFQRNKPNYSSRQENSKPCKEIGIKGNLESQKYKSGRVNEEEEDDPEWADIEINDIIHGHEFKSLPNENEFDEEEENKKIEQLEENHNVGLMDGRIDLSVLQKMNQNLFQNEDKSEPNVLDELLDDDENSNEDSENSSKFHEKEEEMQEQENSHSNVNNINNVRLNLNPVNQFSNINNVNPMGFNNIRQHNFMQFQNNMMNQHFQNNMNKGQFNMHMNQNMNFPFMGMSPHLNPMFNQNPRMNLNMNPKIGFNPNSIHMNMGNNLMMGNMPKFQGMMNNNMFNMPFSPSNNMNPYNQMNIMPNNNPNLIPKNMHMGIPNQKSADSRALECIYKNLIDKGWMVQVKNKQVQKLNSYELFDVLDKFLVENENNLERILIQDFHSDALFHPKVLWHNLLEILPIGSQNPTTDEISSRKNAKAKSNRNIKIAEDAEDKGICINIVPMLNEKIHSKGIENREEVKGKSDQVKSGVDKKGSSKSQQGEGIRRQKEKGETKQENESKETKKIKKKKLKKTIVGA